MGLFTKAIKENPKLLRGKVWCLSCHHESDVDSEYCLANGWPKCCGKTMTLDAPDERGKSTDSPK